MIIKTHNIDHKKVAEVLSETILISNVEDGLDLMGDL